jgi:hypothetical protein
VDINTAIDAYSRAGGNRIEPLQALYSRDPTSAKALAAEISNLQESIMDLVRSRAGKVGLAAAEIEQLARQYLATTKPEVNEVGLRGLLQYVTWLAWHDG